MNRAAALAGPPTRPCRTAALPVAGGFPLRVGPPDDADVLDAVRQTMARTVADVLVRRSCLLLLAARAAIEAAPRTAALLAPAFGREARWQAAQVDSFHALANRYLPA